MGRTVDHGGTTSTVTGGGDGAESGRSAGVRHLARSAACSTRKGEGLTCRRRTGGEAPCARGPRRHCQRVRVHEPARRPRAGRVARAARRRAARGCAHGRGRPRSAPSCPSCASWRRRGRSGQPVDVPGCLFCPRGPLAAPRGSPRRRARTPRGDQGACCGRRLRRRRDGERGSVSAGNTGFGPRARRLVRCFGPGETAARWLRGGISCQAGHGCRHLRFGCRRCDAPVREDAPHEFPERVSAFVGCPRRPRRVKAVCGGTRGVTCVLAERHRVVGASASGWHSSWSVLQPHGV
mmetsp:Transcript_23149/g.80666  ORF Transcript_23149/g.80666 Transcript_23149/m.80666 type:complete len:294 (-) Transcript_23149:2433-3314(-)